MRLCTRPHGRSAACGQPNDAREHGSVTAVAQIRLGSLSRTASRLSSRRMRPSTDAKRNRRSRCSLRRSTDTPPLFGRMPPLLATIHPGREPHHRHGNAKHKERRDEHVNLERIEFGEVHSRSLRSTALPSRCKAAPRHTQLRRTMIQRAITTCDIPYRSAAAGAKKPAATSAVASAFNQVAVCFVCSL